MKNNKIDLNPQEILECLEVDLNYLGNRDPEASKIIAQFYVKAIKENVVKLIRQKCSFTQYSDSKSVCLECAHIIAWVEKADPVDE